jgi:flagellar motor switch protein FliN/FliY
MTVEQLTKLEPGNLLEIEIHPENGVLLTIQGKAVGKGELIRVGEAIGVRVLQLGHG